MKRAHAIAGGLGLLALCIAGALFAAMLNLGRIVRHVVNTHGPALTKTDVRLGAVDLRLFGGRATLRNLYIGNPAGFRTPALLTAETVLLSLNWRSLFGDPLIIERLEIDSPGIAYETAFRTDNFRKLGHNLQAQPSGEPGDRPGRAAPARKTGKKKGRRVVIRHVVIRNARVAVTATALGGRKLSLNLPELRLRDVGGSAGVRPGEAARLVLAALQEKIRAAAGPAGRVLGPAGGTTRSLGDGLKRGLDRAAGGIKKLFGR